MQPNKERIYFNLQAIMGNVFNLCLLLCYAFLVNVFNNIWLCEGKVRVDQSSMVSMNEASEAIDGNPTTYSRTDDRPGQNWTITFDNSFRISCIFIRIRGAGAHKMFYLYVSENDAITNRTFCNEFSFSNTVINEELIECQTPMHGNKIILQRDGEIQLFEFRPFVVGSDAIYDIISNTHGNCFETPPINNTTIDNISRIEKKCSICYHLITQLCEDLKKTIPIEDPTSNIETNSTPTDENEIAIDSRDSIFSVFGPLWICMVSLGGFVVLLVPAVLIRIKSKKQKGPENYDTIPLQEIHQNLNDLSGIDSVLNEEERVYSNISSHRIPIDTFINQVERKKICNQFSDEFQSLSNDACDFIATASLREDDYTRLNLDNKDSSNRLNKFSASFIDGCNKKRAYIAAQGPSSSSSISDFWEMIWENNCTRVVNLTNDSCSEMDSSVRYWPSTDNQIGSFFINIERHDVYEHYIIRQMLVKKINGVNNKGMRMQHFHFTSWHNQSLPECTDSLLCLRELVKEGTAESDGPILVHCSMGTSQTGIFIALDYLLEESIYRGDIDVITCISRLRKQRPSAVQTCDEYIFLHDAVVQYYSKRRQDSTS